jgi:acetyl-CoA carboxylase biotin carboxyl carrier protein
LNFKEILELIDKVADRGIAGVEIEQAGTKIRIEGKTAGPQVVHSYAGDARGGEAPPVAPGQAVAAPAASAEVEADDDTGLHVITSPIVGTFYRAANPEADVFVNVGDRVAQGTVLCIIEAMKLMNEIESDVEGVIARIYPQNAQPVEYGEKLFAVKVSS